MIPGTSIATFRDYPAMSALRRFRPSRPILPASWCPACPNLGGSQLAQCAFRFARRVALREFLSSPACENILLFRNSELPCGLAIPPRLQRRVSRSSRHARRVAVDAICRPTSGIDADGQVVWSWRAHAGAKSAAMLTHRGRRRWQTSWFTGESAK